MSPREAIAFDESAAAPLARALLPRAARALAVVAPDRRGPLLAAIDGFLAAPGPARFLACARALDEAARAARLDRLRTGHAERSLEAALAQLRADAILDGETIDALAWLPAADRAGDRLAALAALACARATLEARVAAEADSLRRAFAAAVAHEPAPRRSARAARAEEER